MENEVKNHDIPDFGPDDDTEDMTGVSIFDPYSENNDVKILILESSRKENKFTRRKLK